MGNIIIAFFAGGFFGGIMNISGASERIGRTFVKKFGAEALPYVLYIVSSILYYGGIMGAIFILAYLSFGMCREANLPRELALASIVGATAFSMFAPGSAATPNLVPTFGLGTDLYAGLGIGIVCSIVSVVLNIFCLRLLTKSFRARGVGYNPLPDEKTNDEVRGEDEMPSFMSALFPVLFVVVVCIILIRGFNMDSTHAIVITQVLAALYLIIFEGKHIHEDKWGMTQKTILPALTPLVGTSAVVGFGAVVATTSAFDSVIAAINSIDMNPYITTYVAVILISAISADCMGGVSIFMATLGPQMLAAGVNPSPLHRLVALSSATFDSLPHNGSVNMNLTVFQLTHKEGYKYQFFFQALIPFAVSIVCLAGVLLFY
jgi:H+/gluconate symporter-like permease